MKITMNYFKNKFFCFAGLFLLCILNASAAPNPTNSIVEAQLIAEPSAIGSHSKFWVILRLKMKEGWHIYAKNPGDSGIPTKIIWHLPDGFVAGDPLWPIPKKFTADSLTTYGYQTK